MILLSANNATTNLAAGISASTTTIILTTGTGSLFPSPSTGEYFPLTLNDALTRQVFEICWCTARTGDSLTVMRGQEGTSARSWLIGDYASNNNTAGSIQTGRSFSAGNVPTLPFTVPPEQNGIVQYCGSTGTITLPVTSGIVDGFLCPIVATSSSATVTVNTNSATVAFPTGNVTTSFVLNGSVFLQWNATNSVWYSVGIPGGLLLNVQTFSASGTYNATFGTRKIVVEAVGPGGPGGGLASTGTSQVAASSGGAAGSYIKALFTSGFTGGISVVIGQPNAPVYGGTASVGTNTTLGGTMVVAPAGTPGYVGSAAGPGGALAGVGPSTAPSTTGSQLTALQGAPGTGPIAYSTTEAAIGGAGGSSPFGTGGIARSSSDGFASAGTGYGAGGGGGAALAGSGSTRPGGAATGGFMLIWEYS